MQISLLSLFSELLLVVAWQTVALLGSPQKTATVHTIHSVLFVLGHRDRPGLPEKCQHRALLPEAGLGGDQVLPGGHDEPGGQQACSLPAAGTPQVRAQASLWDRCSFLQK